MQERLGILRERFHEASHGLNCALREPEHLQDVGIVHLIGRSECLQLYKVLFADADKTYLGCHFRQIIHVIW